MINANGANLRQITFTEKTGGTSPIFSSDGLQMAFAEIDGKNSKPYILDMTKKWQEQPPVLLPLLADFKGSYIVRSWSADANKLLLIQFESENN